MTTFLKDWLPSVAIIVAGVWVFVQWVLNHLSQRKREMDACDGHLDVRRTALIDGSSIVTLEGHWRNLSPLPVEIDTKRSRVDVFAVPTELAHGPLVPKAELGEPLCRHCFLADSDGYALEPKTESTIQTHFVLPPGLYALRMKLYRHPTGHSSSDFAWTREHILDMRGSPNQTDGH